MRVKAWELREIDVRCLEKLLYVFWEVRSGGSYKVNLSFEAKEGDWVVRFALLSLL